MKFDQYYNFYYKKQTQSVVQVPPTSVPPITEGESKQHVAVQSAPQSAEVRSKPAGYS